MRKLTLIFAVALCLAGCGPTRAELDAQDQNQCHNYGFWEGTSQFASCRMHLDQNRQMRIQAALDSITVPQMRPVTCFHSGGLTSCY